MWNSTRACMASRQRMSYTCRINNKPSLTRTFRLCCIYRHFIILLYWYCDHIGFCNSYRGGLQNYRTCFWNWRNVNEIQNKFQNRKCEGSCILTVILCRVLFWLSLHSFSTDGGNIPRACADDYLLFDSTLFRLRSALLFRRLWRGIFPSIFLRVATFIWIIVPFHLYVTSTSANSVLRLLFVLNEWN